MIKKGILIISIMVLLFSCNEAPKNYAIFSGEVANSSTKEITIKGQSGFSKNVVINADGTFSDTLYLKNVGELFILSIDKSFRVYLKNGDNLKVDVDISNFEESIKFTGKGSKVNNYLAKKIVMQRGIAINELFELEKEAFDKKSSEITEDLIALFESYKIKDTAFYNKEKSGLLKIPEMLSKQYEQVHSKNKGQTSLDGKASPDFKNYENFKGGTTSLKDLKGKYVYIDVWATWCRPCLGEIPHLQKLEEEFKGKNIHFVSISVDRESAKETWKKMILDKKMGGIQLFAVKGDSFANEYKISSIPRFILLDPKGIVVKSHMSRPSNPKTRETLKKLLN